MVFLLWLRNVKLWKMKVNVSLIFISVKKEHLMMDILIALWGTGAVICIFFLFFLFCSHQFWSYLAFSVQPYYHHPGEQEESEDEDTDDSNDESNWRNDYPDTDEDDEG